MAGHDGWDEEVRLKLPGVAMGLGQDFMMHITMKEDELTVWMGGYYVLGNSMEAHLNRRYYNPRVDHVQVAGDLELYQVLRYEPEPPIKVHGWGDMKSFEIPRNY